jgi:hypothetical protein
MSDGRDLFMTYHTRPSDQGQTVEVSYALTPYGIICRTFDRSDRSTSYELREETDDEFESFEPWNNDLPPSDGWEPTDEETAARLIAD